MWKLMWKWLAEGLRKDTTALWKGARFVSIGTKSARAILSEGNTNDTTNDKEIKAVQKSEAAPGFSKLDSLF